MHLKREAAAFGIPVQQLQPMDRHRSWRQVHGLSPTGTCMSSFPVHMNRRHLWWSLLDCPAKAVQGLLQLFCIEFRPRNLFQQLPFKIVAARPRSQLNDALVSLFLRKVREQPGCRSEGDWKHPCDRRIEGSTVSHPFEAVAAAQTAHAGMGRQTCRFIDHHEAEGCHQRKRSGLPPDCCIR